MKSLFLSSIVGVALLLSSCTQAETAVTKPVMDDNMHMMSDGTMMMNNDMSGMSHGSSMTMDDMVNMLKGKTGDELDAAFLEGMIPHHQGAIDMANLVLQNAKHEEIRQMARDIISAQQREIDMMKQWQRDWGYVQ